MLEFWYIRYSIVFLWIKIREYFSKAQGTNILKIFNLFGSEQSYPVFPLFVAVIGQNTSSRPT
jgi:hypothetical protein